MLYQYSKKDIKEAVKAAVKKELLSEMQSKVKVSDRLSDDPQDNSYIILRKVLVSDRVCTRNLFNGK